MFRRRRQSHKGLSSYLPQKFNAKVISMSVHAGREKK